MYLISLIKKYPKSATTILVACLCYASFFIGKNQNNSKVVVEEKIVYQVVEVEVEKIVKDVERITVVVEKPDGTRETRTEERERQSSESSRNNSETVNSDSKVDIKPNVLSSYMLGAKMHFNDKLEQNYSVEAGIRLFGPFWLKSEYITTNSFGIGLSVEF